MRAPHFHVVETIPAQSKVRFQPPASRRSALPPAQGKGTPAFVDLALSAAVVLAPPLLHVRLRGRAGAYLVIVCVCVEICLSCSRFTTAHLACLFLLSLSRYARTTLQPYHPLRHDGVVWLCQSTWRNHGSSCLLHGPNRSHRQQYDECEQALGGLATTGYSLWGASQLCTPSILHCGGYGLVQTRGISRGDSSGF